MLQNPGDVALRDVGSGHSGLDLGILEVFFNLNDSMRHQKIPNRLLRKVDASFLEVLKVRMDRALSN